jgi:hypothetical protein
MYLNAADKYVRDKRGDAQECGRVLLAGLA